MGHKGPVLRPRYTGPGRARTQILFYSILFHSTGLKQNIYGHEFKEDGEVANSFDTMAGNTGYGLVSTGNREGRPTVP